MEEISISTGARREIIDITSEVEAIVAKSGVKEGICVVYAPHATAAILIMEADGLVEKDVLSSLSNLVPNDDRYEHSHGSEGHGASHVKSSLFSPSESIPVSKGKLRLGTWQSIAFCELDGPRSDRKALIQVIGA
ncbi:YjbQ family protein [Candidatus Woesearchaeota archaeon]|nr:YjbQ family protein [Candidatus Woesearchaeota archaeon]